MFKLIKLVIWIAGVLAIAYLAMRYFGYDVNWQYLSESREKCEARMRTCKEEFFAKGYENPNCKFNCLEAGLIYKKK